MPKRVIKSWPTCNKIIASLVIITVAVVGVYALVTSRASSPAVGFEAESGTLNGGAAIKSDTNASGSSYVGFEAASTPVIDSSSPAVIGIPGSTCANPVQSVTTPTFSPPANSRIYIVVSADSYPTGDANCLNETIQNSIASVTSTAANSWSRVADTTQRNSGVGGFVDLWTTTIPTAQTNMQISVNFAAPMKAEPNQVSPSGLLKVIVVDNAGTTQTVVPSAVDQMSSKTSTATATINNVPANSLAFMTVDYWNSYSTPPSVPSGQTVVGNVNNQGETDTWTVSDITTSGSSGPVTLTQNITDSGHPTDNWHAVAWAVTP